jgi:hypothetical protein
MNQETVNRCAAELTSLLEQLVGLQKTLHGVIGEKLGAMRRCDTEAMMSAAQREGQIASSASALDERRQQIVAELCEALGIRKPATTKYVTLRALGTRLEESVREPLMRLGDSLREWMLKVAESNRVVEMVCRELLSHFKVVFAAFTQNDDGPGTYSRGGAVEAGNGVKVLDAMG